MIKTNIKVPINYSQNTIIDALVLHIPIEKAEIRELKILKRRLNINDKADIHYDMTVGVSLSDEREAGLLKMRKKVFAAEDFSLNLPKCCFGFRPVVIGAGPAGLFSALLLAEAGAKPVLYERGLDVDSRVQKVESFTKFGVLDPECNIQFGEGGAGSFSDGKLKTGSLDKYKMKVLSEFVQAGAPEDILYSVGAHVGTDKLREIVKKIRSKIVSLGGEVHFASKLTKIKITDGRVTGGTVERPDGTVDFDTDCMVIATGHSARDTYELLRSHGAPMQAKGFGIGMRIEHPREYINDLVYGKNAPSELGSASYHLVTHLKGGRSVYSFCMCPGGVVVPAASEAGGIVTNGMSEYARMADNSNSALLVSVTPEDFGSDDVLAGIDFQRKIERAAFSSAGCSYKAPSTSVYNLMNSDFASKNNSTTPSYAIGTVNVSPYEYLPSYIPDSLKEGMVDFDEWMPGFNIPDAVLTGPETRTTSPVRVVRDNSLEVAGIEGLYPAGEGAGYAGGIISSARDGLLIAEKIIEKASI